MFIFNFFTRYILVILYDSFISLIIVLSILFIFRIKNSNIKILFLFIPLIKPFIIIIENLIFNQEFFNYRSGTFGFRFPSPNTIIGRIDSASKNPINYSNVNSFIILTILLCILIILIFRWCNLYIFYKNLSKGEIASKEEIPEIYKISEKFSNKLKIKTPNIILTYNTSFSPFVIGFNKHNLVLAPDLIKTLTFKEKETLIQHELSHIKRKDNLIGWFALIFKDLLFFNPFAYISYYLIKLEQEKGSDNLIIRFSNNNGNEIAKNTLNLILKIKNIKNTKKTSYLPTNNYFFTPFKIINYKILKNRIKSILTTNIDKSNIRIFSKILMYFLFIFIMSVQIVLIVKLDNSFVFLR